MLFPGLDALQVLVAEVRGAPDSNQAADREDHGEGHEDPRRRVVRAPRAAAPETAPARDEEHQERARGHQQARDARGVPRGDRRLRHELAGPGVPVGPGVVPVPVVVVVPRVVIVVVPVLVLRPGAVLHLVLLDDVLLRVAVVLVDPQPEVGLLGPSALPLIVGATTAARAAHLVRDEVRVVVISAIVIIAFIIVRARISITISGRGIGYALSRP